MNVCRLAKLLPCLVFWCLTAWQSSFHFVVVHADDPECTSADDCDEDDLTIASCSANGACEYQDCRSDDLCMVDSVENGECVNTPVDCDDGNPLTKDSCNSSSGCEHECDDGNACTREEFVDGICQYLKWNGTVDDCASDDSNCYAGVINCDDEDSFTTDICRPSTGCEFLSLPKGEDDDEGFEKYDQILLLMSDENEEIIIYDNSPDLTEDEVKKILQWIKLEVGQLRTPFCCKCT